MSTYSTPSGSGSSGPRRGQSTSGLQPNPLFWLDSIDEQMRRLTSRRPGRASRGDVRAAILALLADEPMHGYQIIHEIEQRSAGTWKPSAGSVYPTLQMLADEGLVTSHETDGKKVYELTDAGREEAEASQGKPAPWATAAEKEVPESLVLPKAAARLAQAIGPVLRGGSPVQVKAVTEVIDEARRKIYTILAQD
ncbi:PadR family transcriptional regulator [Propionibacterium sp.]|uniref:PadR family transcriptional regulator n=1 Tax=Propionibacterium sp. TaxID=1977903 RepID=UPI0039E9EB53